uniref:gamma-aminobutyric acid receptor subunit pi-like n=1 Tax=Myxine glutinosa TaxID=7769 RepID=UPI00358FFD8E
MHYLVQSLTVLLWTSVTLHPPSTHVGRGFTKALPQNIQHLMKGYNKYLRPFFEREPVEVGMSLDIASIDTISEINMDYTATIFLRQRWQDERLLLTGNRSLSVDGRLVEMLWVPDTFIVDSKKSFLHDITVDNRLIRIFPNGTVLYALRITATVACNMDLTKYPMDKQTCSLQLESWGYNTDDMVFYWTRGNDSVKGLDSLKLAQYTVEKFYTSVSEAVYETVTTIGASLQVRAAKTRCPIEQPMALLTRIRFDLGLCRVSMHLYQSRFGIAHMCHLNTSQFLTHV